MARWVWSRVLGVFVAVLALMAGLMLAIAGPSQAAASACDAVSGNLVDDCGFEGGAAPSWWSFGSPEGLVGVDFGESHTGSWEAVMGQGTISQTLFDALPNATYQVSYWLLNYGVVDNQWTFSVSNVVGGTVTLDDTTYTHPFGYTKITHTFTTTASEAPTLTFDAGGGATFLLDDVVVTPLPPTVKPQFTSPNHATFSVGSPASFTVTTTRDGAHGTAALTCAGCVLPAGVSFVDQGDGTARISGTPTSLGVYHFTITATNSDGHTKQNFTLTVQQAPTLTGPSNVSFTAGSAGAFTYQAAGFPGAPSISVSGTLPAGVSLGAPVTSTNSQGAMVTTVKLQGNPAAGSGGVYAVTLTATNGVSPDASLQVSITVDEAPALTGASDVTFTAGSPGTFTYSATGYPTASVSLSGELPDGLSFTSGAGTASITGTPAAGSGGVYPVTLVAANGVLPDATLNATITVDQAPQLTGPVGPSFTVGASGLYAYQATGYPGVPSISISSGSLPSGLSLGAPVHSTNAHGDNVTTVALQGTPAAGTGGVYDVTLVASNGTLPDATLATTITVYEAPHFTSAPHATFIATKYNSFQVTAAGGYPPGPLTFSETGALPPGVSLSSSGLLSGTPPVSASGYWHFTITVSNGHASASQDFVLFIHAPKVPASALVAPSGLTVTALSATGECVTWHLSGYAPYAPVTIIAYPRLTHAVPYQLGTVTAGFNGRLTVHVCLPDSARGTYDLLAAGYATNGSIHYQEAWTIVQP